MWLIILPLILLLFSSPHWWRKIKIKRWRSALQLDKHESAFMQLYNGVNGYALSRESRTQDAMEYVYGEIDFSAFVALLSLAKPGPETVFYDLGSGTGKAVVACAMVFNVRESHGIELFEPLHNAACAQKQALSNLTDYATISETICFLNADFLYGCIDNATLVFINATGFFGSTWIAISERLALITTCTTVITTSKALRSNAFYVTKTTTVEMSWGTVKAYIQERIKIDSVHDKKNCHARAGGQPFGIRH